VIAPARSSWRCLKGHTDGPKASWSRVCVSCLYLALRPCIVRRVSRARGRGVPSAWRTARRNSKHGGARDGGRGPGEARAVFTFVSAENLDISYIIPPRNRGSRARSSKHPLRPSTAISFHRAPAGSGRPRGAGRVASERAHSHELRRPQNAERGRRPAHMCVWCACGQFAQSHGPHSTADSLASRCRSRSVDARDA
jgi:hypothetical protein